MRGKITNILFIVSFCESLTIQPPIKRLIDIKCIQNIIRKILSENKFDKLSIPKYSSKFPIKSKELIYDLYNIKKYAPLRTIIGNIEVTKYLHM